ncbi:hypothetical protein PILCRDRAFT_328618 [Piloderma croceum F 1598]|uniref:Uncharacterized protein n=1 Tax=Piloderma croceum (strain F 1598) TaxID=765440 RepID=A0A0C3BHV3_PILCF|nr:hypothetical protein PILCRDRAFT_328618 [Piloderma croceum F 1598]
MAPLDLPPDGKITADLNPLPRQIIPRPDTEPLDVDAHFGNPQYIESYNWVNSPSPTVIVPGTPYAAAPTTY